MSNRRHVCRQGVAVWAAWCGAGFAGADAVWASGRPPIRVGPSRAIRRIADAARQALDGDVIEIDAGDYVADVALWDRTELTLRGVGGRVRLLASGAAVEGKAIWVVRRGRVLMENIEFHGARVRDRNGAGIRHESGQLVVRHCRFIDNENGILTGGRPQSSLVVEYCEFGHNGAGDGYSHGLYVGAIDSFRMTGCHVHHGQVGHLVKSRARFNRIEYNTLADGATGRASYELEFPNGGSAEVVGNLIQQAPTSENVAIVSFGAEGYERPDNELALVHNTVINNRTGGGSFVRVRGGARGVLLRNNVFAGRGRIDGLSAFDAAGDRYLELGQVVQGATGMGRLEASVHRRLVAQPLAPLPPALVNSLTPTREYSHPLSTRELSAPLLLPGAFQSH